MQDQDQDQKLLWDRDQKLRDWNKSSQFSCMWK